MEAMSGHSEVWAVGALAGGNHSGVKAMGNSVGHNGMRSVRALGVQSGVGLWSHHRSLWSEVSQIPQRS